MIKMECKKEEAVRDKEIAEKRMQDKDFAGALEFALKVQKLYPGLDDISQMLTICEVLVSAKSNVVGIEKDWYGILQIPNTADESSIEKQYQKLTILLHANKKRFAGSEAAFELVKEAHEVLSDHAQRSLYDSKLQTIIQTAKLTQSLPQPNGNLYSQKQLSIENNFSNHSTTQNQVISQPHEQTQICPTFWTICPFCTNTRYQYPKNLMNRPTRCQKCFKAFIAYELIDRGGLLKAASRYVLNQSTHPEHKNIPGQGAHQVGQQNTIGNLSSTMQCQRNVSRGVTSSEPSSRTRTNAEVAVVYQRKTSKDRDVVGSRAKLVEGKHLEMTRRAQTHKSLGTTSLKRGRNVAAEPSESCDRESTTIEHATTKEDDVAKQNAETRLGGYLQRSTRIKKNVLHDESSSQPVAEKEKPSHGRPGSLDVLPNNKPDEVSSTNCQAEATRMTRPNDKNSPIVLPTQCPSPVYPQRSTRLKKNVIYNKSSSQTVAEKGKPSHGGPGSLDVLSNIKLGEASWTNCQAEATWMTRPNDTSKHKNSPIFLPTHCPGPVFHSFESEKSEDKFQEGQIWALYGSDNGGLPMYYAQIKKVELPKFKVHTERLEPFPSGNDMLWALKGMPFGCGSFKLRTGETEIFETTRTFSHQERAVLWTGDRYYFFPWEGEVWAIYKNWSAEWTLTDVKHCEYELVEVLEHDFAVYRVLILEVVDGFRTIYKGTGIEVDIMWSELLRFSHRVPSFHPREERGGNARAYFVLDPAALPASKQDKARERNVAEQRTSEGKQETSMQFNRICEWPTSPSTRHNCAVSLSDGFTKSTTSPMVLSSEEAKDSQAFAEWAHRGFLEVGCPVEPAELDRVGDEYGRVWVQRCPKLFALFNPSPHYGTIVGVTESYLGLIRSSLWGTFANFVREVAHFDCAVSNSQLACLTDQMKALKEAGFPVKILKNRLKALAFQAQQMASATLEALEVARATAPSMEYLEAAMAAEKEVLAIECALAEACGKLKAAKAQHQALREQKVAMEKEIEVARQELEAAEENLSRVFQL